MLYYIGLMAGTSVDAVDAALVSISNSQIALVDSLEVNFAPALREELKALMYPGEDEIVRANTCSILIAQLFADATLQLLAKSKVQAHQIRAIGSHGQTLRHHPPSAETHTAFTYQIGDPSTIATLTNITTVADFRSKDIALGGQGAPLVPAFHAYAFGEANKKRAIVNIGGVANTTLLDGKTVLHGFDCGPGNGLMDKWIKKQKDRNYDKNGAWAQSGVVNRSLLNSMLAEPYFAAKAPKSTGPELFNLAWLDAFKCNDDPANIQATLCELTALSICNASVGVSDIYLCGGGTQNEFLTSRIIELVGSETNVSITDELGIPANNVEACAFAWLAHQTLEGLAGNLPSSTGAKRAAILGGIYSAE